MHATKAKSGFTPYHFFSKSGKGFIALISAIIIAFTLLVAVVSLGSRGLMGRLYLLDVDNKEASQALAEACVNVALIAVANDPAYEALSVPVSVGGGSCTILSVDPSTPSSGNTTIKTEGIVKGATTYLEVIVASESVEITSWKETANP